MLVTREEVHGTVGGGQLEHRVISDARRCLETGQPERLRYPLGAKAAQCCGGVMELLVETVNAGPSLVLFGGGHVGQALCQVLVDTPFRVRLVEERAEWRDAPEVPGGVVRETAGWEEVLSETRWNAESSYVAVMTHRHDLDEEIVAAFLATPTRYLGLIGSVTKWARFRHRLAGRGHSEEQLARVVCPIGLPLGGKSPREVAISVAAQLLGIHHGGARS